MADMTMYRPSPDDDVVDCFGDPKESRTFAANPECLGRPFLDWLLFLFLCAVWGSSFILMKVGMAELTAYQVASIRILSAGIVLLPYAAAAFKDIPRGKAGLVVLSGLQGTFLPAFLFCLAETRVDSSMAGMLNAMTPIFTMLIGTWFFGHRIGWGKWAGILLGFCGLAPLLVDFNRITAFDDLGYASLIVLATVLYGVNVNMVDSRLREIGSRKIAAAAFSFLIPPSLGILIGTGYFSLPLAEPDLLRATGAAVLLGVLGTAVASVAFYLLLKRAGPLFASLVTYGIPFVAILWGLLFGESVSTKELLCLLTILAGVRLANR